jgi:hypothetical protein
MNNRLSPIRHQLTFLANFLTETLYLPSEPKVQQSGKELPSDENHRQTREDLNEDSGSQEHHPSTIQESEEDYQPSETSQSDKTVSSSSSASIDCYGSYKQGVLILVNQPSSSSLIPKERLVLENILQAVGLSFSDVAVINIRQEEGLTSQRILEEYKPKQIIGFGLPEAFLPDQPAPYQLATLTDGTMVLVGDQLSMIAADKNLKIQLWKSLKHLFSLT